MLVKINTQNVYVDKKLGHILPCEILGLHLSGEAVSVHVGAGSQYIP